MPNPALQADAASGTANATSRLLSLLSLSHTRRDWPGPVLAERLGISHRTVRRDVDRLREMGYSIRSTMGPDGGYRLDAGSELPPLLFDDDQVVAIAVALQAATATGVGIEDGALRALTALRQVMPARLRHRLSALDLTTLPSRPGDAAREPVSPEVLIALSTAPTGPDSVPARCLAATSPSTCRPVSRARHTPTSGRAPAPAPARQRRAPLRRRRHGRGPRSRPVPA